jgi:tetratricopeptide (TPR) repeat protein
MATAPTPAALPPHILERGGVRAALARLDLGEVFRLAREYTDGVISFSKIAEAINVKAERVGLLARGQGRIESFDKILEVADGLRIPGHLIGLAPRPWEAQAAAQAVAVPPQAGAASSLFVGGGEDLWEVTELVRRTEASNINSASMEAIEQAIDQLACAYPYAPADKLHGQTRQGLEYVTKQLEDRMSLRQHRDLLVDTGWLFLLNACVQYDRGQREAAELSRNAALRIGIEAGHGEIQAWAWEIAAWFALTQGRYQDMLAAVEAGHVADSTHSVGVQLYAHKAKAYAHIGDARAVRDALDAGRARLERLPRPEHPEHHFIIDPDKWDFYEMDAYRLLGEDELASRHANEVIRVSTAPDGTEHSPMRIAEARLTLGVTAARQGELDQAITIGTQALGIDRKSLPSLILVAGELVRELQAHHPREAATQEFTELVKAVTRAKPPERTA